MKAAIKERYPDLKIAKDAVSNRTLRIGGKPSFIGRDHIRGSRRSRTSRQAANNILANIYQPVFIETSIKDPVGAAIDLYQARTSAARACGPRPT